MSDIKKKDELLDDGLEDLIQKRKSVPLTPDNAHFYRSEGGLVSLIPQNTHRGGAAGLREPPTAPWLPAAFKTVLPAPVQAKLWLPFQAAIPSSLV